MGDAVARLRRLLSSPRFWLWVQLLAVFFYRISRPDFELWVHLDSKSYLSTLDPDSIEETLSYVRTVGYPLFLRGISALSGGLDLLPHVQLLLFLLSVVAFSHALETYAGWRWRAMAAASPLLYDPITHQYATSVGTDVLAASLALVTIACLLWWLDQPSRLAPYLTLALSLFATYQVRPAFLFLLPLVPFAGGLLLAAASVRSGRPFAHRAFLGVVAVALLPFLLWSGLRWALTGHFGLVSFGGINLIGITASMLSPRLVRQLPAEDRPLARAILKARGEHGLSKSGRYDYSSWYRNYNPNIWELAFPAAEKVVRREGQTMRQFWVEANRRFGRLSWHIVKLRPHLYRRWIGDSLSFAAERIGQLKPVRWLGWAVLLTLPVALARRFSTARQLSGAGDETRFGLDLALFAGLYLVASLLTAVAVEPPIDRYTFAAALLVPSGLCGLLTEILQLLRSPSGQGSER